ncbi:aldehyde dehydrogenase (NAD+) [Scopulibacillus darangshiensis]|uniref:Aldehyde dehydrogenase (NAD+) n=1 Tax=Scopulibacillus darangshiensis TaxID=442528 RepID=A0A4R2P3P4_9BACL|nr:aldehyde dehydrogenase family protein [Scopulibacillus darangshiensis]TCP28768.1 aldehyde dehydrogenase (NAD+) [Scopulibacillus darangshiensis]
MSLQGVNHHMTANISKMFINGKWLEQDTGETIGVMNPANGEIMYHIPRGQKADIDRAVASARDAFESQIWQTFKPETRGRILWKMADLIRRDKDSIAEMETLDTGKPLSQAKADVEAGAGYFEYYAGMADKILGETIPIASGILDFTVREPVGVTSHIVPWNYPLQIASRSTAAAIATGNTVVMKPAEDTPATALKLARLFEEAGLPKGVFNVVTGYGYEAGAALSDHPGVDHVTFTGSVETGMAVMTAAAKNITPVTLELGGKSPNIVFSDCHWDEALNTVMRSIIQNAGQTCSAGSRLLVQKDIHDRFVDALCEKMQSLVIGPGIDDCDLGPILSEKQCRKIESYIDFAKQEGVAIKTGGNRANVEGSEGGFYFQPTVLDHVAPDSRLAKEEIFGPVIAVFPFETEKEALKLANHSPYGLVAGIWTKDIGKAHRLAEKIRAGQIFINNYGAGGGIQMPFGGYKKSGFGREKGLEALRNYTQLKNVAIKTSL